MPEDNGIRQNAYERFFLKVFGIIDTPVTYFKGEKLRYMRFVDPTPGPRTPVLWFGIPVVCHVVCL